MHFFDRDHSDVKVDSDHLGNQKHQKSHGGQSYSGWDYATWYVAVSSSALKVIGKVMLFAENGFIFI